jgi:hypothetical protein
MALEHSAALVGEPQHDQWHPDGRFGMYSLLMDPATAWQEKTGPFAPGGDPSLDLLASAAQQEFRKETTPLTGTTLAAACHRTPRRQ